MWQIEPVATTWQIGLSRGLGALNLNAALSNPTKAQQLNLCGWKRATWLFGEGFQTSAVRAWRSAAVEHASITFCESSFNCAISQPCNISFCPQCSQCFHVCLQLWHVSLPGAHSCLSSLHTSVLAFVRCSVSGWSLQRKDMSLIPVVMISAETRWSSSEIPSHLLEDRCHINKKVATHCGWQIRAFKTSQKCQHPDKGSF